MRLYTTQNLQEILTLRSAQHGAMPRLALPLRSPHTLGSQGLAPGPTATAAEQAELAGPAPRANTKRWASCVAESEILAHAKALKWKNCRQRLVSEA
jgi:hypothetical protein